MKVNIKKIDEHDAVEIFRLYIEAQASFLKMSRETMKAIFVMKSAEHDLFSPSLLSSALHDISAKVTKQELTLEELDLLLETMLQISQPSDKLQEAVLSLVENLS